MAYVVIKTIKGRRYRYLQRTYRAGSNVRTETIYLGPVDGGSRRKGVLRRIGDFIEAQRTRRNGFPSEETMLRQYNEMVERDRQARDIAIAHLHDLYGLRMSSQSQESAVPRAKAPSQADTGEVDTPGAAPE